MKGIIIAYDSNNCALQYHNINSYQSLPIPSQAALSQI